MLHLLPLLLLLPILLKVQLVPSSATFANLATHLELLHAVLLILEQDGVHAAVHRDELGRARESMRGLPRSRRVHWRDARRDRHCLGRDPGRGVRNCLRHNIIATREREIWRAAKCFFSFVSDKTT